MTRINFMGVPVDALSMDQTVDKVLQMIEEKQQFQHVCINPGKVIRMMEDPEIREIVRRCEVISADGIGDVSTDLLITKSMIDAAIPIAEFRLFPFMSLHFHHRKRNIILFSGWFT